jgi:thymidylate kinase
MDRDGRAARPIEIVVDGTDGAGKTPCVEALVQRLHARGLRVASHAPYREREVYPLWETEPVRAAATIVGLMNQFMDRHPDAQVVVWDRGWPTAFVTTDEPRARALFEPFPALTVLLLNTVERTREKAKLHARAGIWATDDALVRRFNAAYHSLEASRDHRILRLFPDATSRFDLGQVGRDVERALEGHGFD